MVIATPAALSGAALGTLLLGAVILRLFRSHRVRSRRCWRGLQRLLPPQAEGGAWIREGALGLEGPGGLGWGSPVAERYAPHALPLGLGRSGLHLHPWPVATGPCRPWQLRMKPLCAPWNRVRATEDPFAWELCENPRLVLRLTAEGARALEAHLGSRTQEVP